MKSKINRLNRIYPIRTILSLYDENISIFATFYPYCYLFVSLLSSWSRRQTTTFFIISYHGIWFLFFPMHSFFCTKVDESFRSIALDEIFIIIRLYSILFLFFLRHFLRILLSFVSLSIRFTKSWIVYRMKASVHLWLMIYYQQIRFLFFLYSIDKKHKKTTYESILDLYWLYKILEKQNMTLNGFGKKNLDKKFCCFCLSIWFLRQRNRCWISYSSWCYPST